MCLLGISILNFKTKHKPSEIHSRNTNHFNVFEFEPLSDILSTWKTSNATGPKVVQTRCLNVFKNAFILQIFIQRDIMPWYHFVRIFVKWTTLQWTYFLLIAWPYPTRLSRTWDPFQHSIRLLIQRSREGCKICNLNDRIALKFDRPLRNNATEKPVEYQSDRTILNKNLAASNPSDILRLKILDTETAPWKCWSDCDLYDLEPRWF